MNHFQLKHMANAEERVMLHNLAHPDNPCRLPHGLVTHAAFSDPQVASVGLTDPQARTLLGAHIIGPQAAVLLQPLLQAMTLGQTVDQLARHVRYMHPALTEVAEQALLEL